MHHNFDLLSSAVSRLGGIPSLLTAEACLEDQGPDIKVVVSYLAFLCARLLEVSKEERAAYTIQQIWKRRKAWTPGRPEINWVQKRCSHNLTLSA